MRPVLCGLAAGLLACHAGTAFAQQGNVVISGAGQVLTGGARQGEDTLEPDFGVSWIQPGVDFGSFQVDLRGSKRGDRMHLGRNYAALRDLKRGAVSWSFEAGDAYFTRALGEYGFSNLRTPSVTFSGGVISARGPRGDVHIIGGRGTAWRNIFGTDPDTLAQTIGLVRGTYKVNDRLDVLGRISRIQTSDLREFSFTMTDSKQAGGGIRFILVPAVQLIADGSYLQYRRVDSPVHVADGSFLTGANFLLPRGWIQVNASRFSPGEFPAMNDPLHDRESIFGAGEYEFWSRATFFGGWETLTTNIDPDLSAPSSANLPRTTLARGFGGVRMRLSPEAALTVRIEEGDRISRPVQGGLARQSDTGARSVELQTLIGPMTAYARATRRLNVDNVSRDASYTQDDVSGQVFLRATRRTQLFGVATITRHESGTAQGSSYWQLGGGAELQIPKRDLWVRGETTISRNVDLVTREFVPRQAFSLGVNGQLARDTAFSLNIAADRTPLLLNRDTLWNTRSIFRVTQNFSTGTARVIPAGAFTAAARARGTGQIIGSVYTDWNSNGIQEPDEAPLENIPIRISALTTVTTRRDGEFAFLNVPVGPQQVGLDTAAVPVDFDPPAVSMVDLDLDRGATRRVSFGLIPLGSVRGRVVHDGNANGKVDPGEEAVEGAVLVLDKGMRSEQVRRGAYRFDSIRSGDHVVALLPDSLPEGAVITSAASVPLALTRGSLVADIDFLVTIAKRPETRRVFPPRGGGAQAPAPRPLPRAEAAGTPRTPAPSATAAAAGTPAANGSGRVREAPAQPAATDRRASIESGRFVVQIAALNDPLRARLMVHDLSLAGYPAYVLEPGAADPDGPYRVRIGGYRSREAAAKAAATLQKLRGEKLWVISEPATQ